MSNRIRETLQAVHHTDTYDRKYTWMKPVHPCVKLLITVFFLVMLLSFHKYNLAGTLLMSAYLIVVFQMGELSLINTLCRLKELLLLLFLVGIWNLFLDRNIIAYWGKIPVSGGVLSFCTLYLKGVFALLSSYALLMTTGIEGICYALQVFHMPGILITVVLLIYRYFILFAREVERVSLAYSMRSNGQKGIQIRAWGSMVGTMLLRSVDRAETVYESMELRGYSNKTILRIPYRDNRRRSICYAMFMVVFIFVLRSICG